jgi:hypothetical protein
LRSPAANADEFADTTIDVMTWVARGAAVRLERRAAAAGARMASHSHVRARSDEGVYTVRERRIRRACGRRFPIGAASRRRANVDCGPGQRLTHGQRVQWQPVLDIDPANWVVAVLPA